MRYPALFMGELGGAAHALGGTDENQSNLERGSQESSGKSTGRQSRGGNIFGTENYDMPREHQMRINPSAPNSYHIIQDDGGDAVDISFERPRQ